MSTFGGVSFSVEIEDGFYPHIQVSDDNPLQYTCKAIINSKTDLNTLLSLRGKVTPMRALGTNSWTGIIEYGAEHQLAIPSGGQAASKQTDTYVNAVLTNVETRGNAQKADSYRVEMTFIILQVVG